MSLVPGNVSHLRIPPFAANGAVAPGVSVNHDSDAFDTPKVDTSGTLLRMFKCEFDPDPVIST